MKTLGKKILKYVLISIVVFLASVIIITYVRDGSFSFSAR